MRKPEPPSRAPALALALAVAAALAACGGASPTGPGAPLPPPASPEPMPSPMPTPVPSPPAVSVLRTASLRGANGHNASGTARIVREADAHRLELLDDFRIDISNNDVYLARGASLDMSRDLFVGALRQRTGAQSYPLPDAGAGYSYVIIWCRPFRIPIALGELR